jgi:APA family basic amino acid/polyamine antiporter
MQAASRSASGTRASRAGLKVTSRHQHEASNDPVAAAAQPFGPPHSGQVGAFSGCGGGGDGGMRDPGRSPTPISRDHAPDIVGMKRRGSGTFGYTRARMSATPGATGPPLTRTISLTQATAMVVGTVIGTSIFVQPSEITGAVPTVSGILLAWAVAGALTFVGALVCAELASAFPVTGGVYVFLREAFSTRLAFLWGWANVWSIHSGVIAAIALVGGRYLGFFLPLSPLGEQLAAVAIIAAITAVNYVGVRAGTTLQTAITAAKLAAIALLLVLGAGYAGEGRGDAFQLGLGELAAVPLDRLLTGIVAGLFAFGGWHVVTYTAGETTDPVRTVPRALMIGTAIITVCYIALNAVYLRVLPLEAVRESPRIAADVAAALVGDWVAGLVSGLVVVSAVGALTGIMLAGPRMYLAMARDGVMLPWIDAVHPTYHTPHRAIVLLGLWASVLVLTGSYSSLFMRAIYTEWLFFALLAVGLFRLRRRPSYRPPYRMWGYPVTPAAFIVVSAAIVANQFWVRPGEAVIGAAIVASGWPLALWITRAARGADPR